MPFTVKPLPRLPEVLLVTPKRHEDARGWFSETFKTSEYRRAGFPTGFPQDNQAFSRALGTIRALHYQNPPSAQGKLISVLQGAIFDVAVDIRRGSPTFGVHASASLDAATGAILWIPPGFAHGLQTLAPDTLVAYKCTSEYDPLREAAIRWNDPSIGIAWPLPDPVLSEKDRRAPGLDQADIRFTYDAQGGRP